jgi:hypothetical protein
MNEDHTPDEDAPPQQWGGSSAPQSQEVRHSQVSALVPERIGRGVFSTGAVVLQGAHEFIIDFLQRMTSPRQLAARVVLPPAVVARLITALRENLNNYERNFGRPAALPQPGQSPTPSSSEPSSDSNFIQQPPQIVSPEISSGQAGIVPQPPSPADAEPDTGSDQTETPSTEQPPQPKSQTQQLPQNSAQELYDQLKLPDEVLSGDYANAVMIAHTQTEFCFDFITTFFPRSVVACRIYLAAPNAARFLDALNHSFEQYQRKLQAQRAAQQPFPPPEPPPDA